MTLETAQQLLHARADFAGYHNAHGAKLILVEVSREHGGQAVDALIRELKRNFGFKSGTAL